MEFLLGAIAIVFCIGLALNGYLVPLLLGGFIGSFFGLAGFGGAVSGMIPGAIVGAVVAIAIKKNKGSAVSNNDP
jgi:Na+/proline symporter